VGRDKALRLVQYLSRFLAWYTLRTNSPQTTVVQWSKLKANLGLVRKAMRIGKFVEHFRAAATAYDSKTLDPVIRFCTTGRQLGYGAYMLTDTLTYLDASGVRPSLAAKKLQVQAYKAWMTGLCFSVLNGVYTIYKSRNEEAAQTDKAVAAEKTVEVKKLQRYVHLTPNSTRGRFLTLSQREKRRPDTTDFRPLRFVHSRLGPWIHQRR